MSLQTRVQGHELVCAQQLVEAHGVGRHEGEPQQMLMTPQLESHPLWWLRRNVLCR